MRAVRAECSAQIKGKAKEVEMNELERTDGNDKTEGGAGQSEAQKPENKEDKNKADQGESTLLIIKTERSIPLPFAPTIMEVHILDTFTPPVFKMYDGSSDPEGHIKSFTNAMAFQTG